jgi:hypothetical protein
MVALVLLLITMIPLGYLVTNEVHQAASAKNSLAALGVAEKWIEILGTAQDPPPRALSLAVDTGEQLIPIQPNGTPLPNNGTEPRGGTLFTVRAQYDWTATQDPNAAPDLCTSGGAQVLNLQVTVSWGVNQHVTDTTILDYPPPGIPQYGFYQLQVSGANTVDVGGKSWLTRVQAIPVTFTPSGGSPVTTHPDQYGCVFAELTPGTYTVVVGNPGGYPTFVENLATDPTNGPPNTPEPTGPLTIATPSPIAITPGVVTKSPTMYYDEGSSIGLSYPSSTSTADGVTCAATGQITCISEGEGTTGSQGATPATATLAFTSGSTWSSAATPSSPTSTTRIASVACLPSIACIGVGYGLTGANAHGAILSDNATTSIVTADAIPANVASLTHVICPTATQCAAWGTLSTGLPVVLAGTISSLGDTWSPVTLPSNPLLNQMTVLNQVACTPGPGSAPPNCVAVGSGSGLLDLWGWESSGPLFGSGTSGGTWVAPLVPITGLANPPNLTQVACPSAGNCMAIGTGQLLPILGLLLPAIPVVVSALFNPVGPGALAWTPVLPTVEPSSFSQLVCMPSNTCLAVGTVGSQAVIYSGTAGSISLGTLLLRVDYSVPGSSSISQVTCPSSATCVAIGSSTTSGTTVPVILSGAIAATDTWSPANSILGGITSVSAVSCPNATNCAIAASNNNGSNPAAEILSGTPGPSTTWSSASIPSADAGTLYLTGISCTPTSGTSTCAAVGASPSGAVIMMSTAGPGGTWNDRTADPGLALTGNPTVSIPIELARSGTNGILKTNGSLGFWNPVAGEPTAGQTIPNAPSILGIFPFAAGYGLSAGDCPAEDATNGVGSVLATTVPGATTASPSGVTVPLAVLPVQVTSSSTGLPASGDVLTLTATTVGTGCGSDYYALQPTGPDGLSRTEVPFGSYSLKVTAGSSSRTSTLVVAPGIVTVGSTVYTLPQTPAVTGP